MKVIFFGLGSIGKRHLKNIRSIAAERNLTLEVHAFRSSKKIEESFTDIKMIFEAESLDDDYDVAFITNPTALHFDALVMIQNKAKYFFIEKPLFERIYDLSPFISVKDQYYIAAPLRYKGVMTHVKEILAVEKVLHARIMCSSYLPNWRAGEDYRKSYSSDPSLGGGIELDCIHELDYTLHLFGLPKNHHSIIGKVSSLEIQSNDSANYLLEYDDKFIEVHVDYFGKFPKRTMELITDKDRWEIDFYNDEVASAESGRAYSYKEDVNDMYLGEMLYFLDEVMHGKENKNNLEHAAAVLKIAKENDA